MPKDTFFNLEPKKRKKILNAARKEFSRTPLDKVKISNIINHADIPRGSFYQYFENIDDLFYFFIEEVQLERESFLLEFARKEAGDIFDYAKNIFGYEYDLFTSHNRHNLMMNIFKSMSLNTDYFEKYNERRKQFIIKLLAEIRVDNLRFSSEKDLLSIFHLIQDHRRSLIHKSTYKIQTKEEIVEQYNWFIDVFKHGILKEAHDE
ncbi:MAG: TetR/AcrR family transcriptional regulator [Candidatus Izemoplasma sp.]